MHRAHASDHRSTGLCRPLARCVLLLAALLKPGQPGWAQTNAVPRAGTDPVGSFELPALEAAPTVRRHGIPSAFSQPTVSQAASSPLSLPHLGEEASSSKNGWVVVGVLAVGSALVGAFQAKVLEALLDAPGRYTPLESAAIWGGAGAAVGLVYCVATHCDWSAPAIRRSSRYSVDGRGPQVFVPLVTVSLRR